MTNLALNKPATQSSDPFGAPPGRAVDGNEDGNFWDGSVSHTNADYLSWWQVDLGASQSIDHVNIFNRTDCCQSRLSNFYVLFSDTPMDPNLYVAMGAGAGHLYFSGLSSSELTIPLGITARYVRVQLAGTDYLQLAEVEVIGTDSGSGSGPITACREIVAPGAYVLGADLASASGSPCISIHDTSNVDLDCGGHRITAPTGIGVTNVNTFSLRNCTLLASGSAARILTIQNTSGGTVTGNTIGEMGSNLDYYIDVHTSNYLNISGNTLNAAYQQNASSHTTISSNVSTCPVTGVPGTIIAANILSSDGTSNTISGNIIDGRGQLSPSGEAGADDGIVIGDESLDVIANNNIRNVWDTGIEWTGHLDQVQITGNQISNALYSAIGGWYWSSLSNCTIAHNAADNVPDLFQIVRIGGLRIAGYDDANPGLSEPAIYLSNNRFDSNVLTHPIGVDGGPNLIGSRVFVAPYAGYSGLYSSSIETTPGPNDFVISNNVFINNDWASSTPSPWFGYGPFPPGAVIDGGGNRCAVDATSTSPGYPIACQSAALAISGAWNYGTLNGFAMIAFYGTGFSAQGNTATIVGCASAGTYPLTSIVEPNQSYQRAAVPAPGVPSYGCYASITTADQRVSPMTGPFAISP